MLQDELEELELLVHRVLLVLQVLLEEQELLDELV